MECIENVCALLLCMAKRPICKDFFLRIIRRNEEAITKLVDSSGCFTLESIPHKYDHTIIFLVYGQISDGERTNCVDSHCFFSCYYSIYQKSFETTILTNYIQLNFTYLLLFPHAANNSHSRTYTRCRSLWGFVMYRIFTPNVPFPFSYFFDRSNYKKFHIFGVCVSDMWCYFLHMFDAFRSHG